MRKCYQFDASGMFVGEIMDYGLLPNNATYFEPEEKEGFHPVWDFENKGWAYKEDHRGKQGWLNGEPFIVQELGELPAGFSTKKPVKIETEKEKKEKRKLEIVRRLTEIDEQSARPLRAVAAGTATDFDRKKLAELEKESSELRAELAELQRNEKEKDKK